MHYLHHLNKFIAAVGLHFSRFNKINLFRIYYIYYLCTIKSDKTLNNTIMNTTEIRSKVAAFIEVGFTQTEAFAAIRDYSRTRTKRSGHALAEIVGNNDKRQFNQTTKQFNNI